MLMEKNEFKKAMRKKLEDHLTLSNPIFKHLLDEENPNEELLRFTTLRGCKTNCVTARFKDEELTAPQTQS